MSEIPFHLAPGDAPLRKRRLKLGPCKTSSERIFVVKSFRRLAIDSGDRHEGDHWLELDDIECWPTDEQFGKWLLEVAGICGSINALSFSDGGNVVPLRGTPPASHVTDTLNHGTPPPTPAP